MHNQILPLVVRNSFVQQPLIGAIPGSGRPSNRSLTITTGRLNYLIVYRSPRIEGVARLRTPSIEKPRELSTTTNRMLVSSSLQNETVPLITLAPGRGRDLRKLKRTVAGDRFARARTARLLYGLSVLALAATACILAALILYILTA